MDRNRTPLMPGISPQGFIQPRELPQTVALPQDDPNKYELEIEPYLDRLYHELLGETLDENKIWQRDYKKKRQMNELGVSDFISEVGSRVSIHMQLSELEKEDIIEISSRASEIFADKMEDHWEMWEIFPTESNFEGIAQKLYDVLFILLMIAKAGGMRKHREKIKNPYVANYPQQQPEAF